MVDKLTEWWNSVSLRTKMTGVSVLLLTVGLIVAGFGSMSVLRSYLTDNLDSRLVGAASQLQVSATTCTPASSNAPSDYAILLFDYDTGASTGCVISAKNGDSDDFPAVKTMTGAYAEANTTAFTTSSEGNSGQWRVVARVLSNSVTGDKVVAVVGLSLSDTNGTIARFAAIFLFFGLTVVIFGAALTRLLVTSTFQPLREVEATAARFAAGDFTQRLGGATPNTEVGRLNRSLNSMLNRIDRAFADRAKTIDQMRRFVGDASHELRTPLVSVRGYAELYRMGALQDDAAVAQAMERIEKEAIRMSGLVEDLLELARMDETKPLQLGEVDLAALARDASLDAMASSPDRVVGVIVHYPIVVEPAELDAAPDTHPETGDQARRPANATGAIARAGATFARLRGRRARVVTEQAVVPALEPRVPSPSITVIAEENKLRQVVANLLGNALRYTPAGSPLEIEVARDDARGFASIAIVDHGEGIPPQLREKIFQRFWRADTSRARETGGNGLGLAIVAGIVAAHHGEIEVLETPGGGATFRVSIPLLPAAAIEAPSTTSRAALES